MRRPDITQRLSEIIHTQVPDARVILYGSEARGDARPDSDIDLLILLNKDKVTYEDEIQITYPLYEVGIDAGIIISTLVVARKQWENRPFKTPFYINVMNEGIVL